MKAQTFAVLLFIGLSFIPLVSAQFNDTISDEDKETFDQILEPVMKIYNLIKYAATFIAVLILLLAGANYIMSGSDPGKREGAKAMIMYVLIGLVIIWAAPLVVQFVTG
ncbi:MAG: pilin [Nanoarchaeota archaeon]